MSMEYRINFLLSLLSTIFPILIQVFLWNAIFGSSETPIVYGYTYHQMILYTIAASIVSKLINADFVYEIAEDIKEGGLNKYFVQPINYFFYRVCKFLGQKTIQAIIVFSVSFTIFFALNIVEVSNFELARGCAFVVAIIGAVVLNFIIFFIISNIAFWSIHVTNLFRSFNFFIYIFSGGVFPLDIFGDKMQIVFNLLPFQYTAYFPVNILSGRLDFNTIKVLLLIQLLWIVFLSICAALVWHVGSKKYVSVGG